MKPLITFPVLVLFFILSGCQEDEGKTYSISGILYSNGIPLKNATVGKAECLIFVKKISEFRY